MDKFQKSILRLASNGKIQKYVGGLDVDIIVLACKTLYQGESNT
jgi:hypothetical protein